MSGTAHAEGSEGMGQEHCDYEGNVTPQGQTPLQILLSPCPLLQAHPCPVPAQWDKRGENTASHHVWLSANSSTLLHPKAGLGSPVLLPPSQHLVGSAAALQEEPEPVAGELVVLQPLAQAPVVILHEAPVQDHLQLACGEQVPAAQALPGISHTQHRAPRDSRTRAPCPASSTLLPCFP